MRGSAGLFGHSFIRYLFLFLLCMSLWHVRPFIIENLAFVFVSKAYGSDQIEAMENYLESALNIICWQKSDDYCHEEHTLFNTIQIVEDQFIQQTMQLLMIDRYREFATSEFSLGGESRANSAALETGVLFGAGFFQGRILLKPDDPENCWAMHVEAQHDDPPPVKLNISIDSVGKGILSFDKGDQSWETQTLLMNLVPGVHWLRLEFINDFSDLENKLDRNAYIDKITLEQVHCGFDD